MPHPNDEFEHASHPRGAAPAWVAVASAWMGFLSLLSAIALPFVGKYLRSRGVVSSGHWRSGDLWLPFPVYTAVVAVVLGMVAMWQMRKVRRPIPGDMVSQRMQAWFGMVLGGLSVALVYIYVFIYVAWRAMK